MKSEEVQKLADLARIKISKKEIKEFSSQLGDILDYVNKVQNYEFIGKEEKFSEDITKLREDNVSGSEPEEIIKQFSDQRGNLLKVKKIL